MAASIHLMPSRHLSRAAIKSFQIFGHEPICHAHVVLRGRDCYSKFVGDLTMRTAINSVQREYTAGLGRQLRNGFA